MSCRKDEGRRRKDEIEIRRRHSSFTLHPSAFLLDRRGSTVETFFWIILASLLFFGAVEIGRGFALKDALDTGVSVAARQLSLDPSAWGDAEAAVRGEVDGNFLGGGSGGQVTLTILDASGATLSPAQLDAQPFGAVFRLRGSVPLSLAIPFLGATDKTIQVEHWSVVERYP